MKLGSVRGVSGDEAWLDRVRRGYNVASTAYRCDDDDPVEYRRWCDALEAVLDRRSDVLDLGCGCGVPVARQLTRSGHRVTGVDMSAVQIERAQRLVPEASFLLGDLCDVAFGAGSFDAVVCLYAIIHVPVEHQPVVIDKIGSWLRPGGRLLLSAGSQAWTGSEERWLGTSATMWWSQADASTYARWLVDAGFVIDSQDLVPDGASAHSLFWARRP